MRHLIKPFRLTGELLLRFLDERRRFREKFRPRPL
jgi:hypothetical protein